MHSETQITFKTGDKVRVKNEKLIRRDWRGLTGVVTRANEYVTVVQFDDGESGYNIFHDDLEPIESEADNG